MKLICFNKRFNLWKCNHPHIQLSVRFETDAVWILALRVDKEYRRRGLVLEVLASVMRKAGVLPVFLFPRADDPMRQAELELCQAWLSLSRAIWNRSNDFSL